MEDVNKVFGIGLPKTGTTSLNAALNHLGLNSIHNPLDLRRQAHEGTYKFDRDDWDALTNFGEHFYPQLDEAYPESKFILTVRDEEEWAESWKRQIEGAKGDGREGVISRSNWYRPGAYLLLMKKALFGKDNRYPSFKDIRIEIFGTYKFNRKRCRYVYNLHKQNVQSYFKEREGDFEIVDICGGGGWEKVCKLLGIEEAPDCDFPHEVPPKTKNVVN
ncbi:hypothetical protein GGQ04_002667 [Salinibacter ruber]|uniref:sulfotransferase family protein n=1 Tax=Salinibacter ruber TaxID=146919 RepID=UPI002168E9F0|nr:sulfotransferase family protein [Salinibacter ruber]MCS4047519.1 hypothetical protein [Salinibacter ruber]